MSDFVLFHTLCVAIAKTDFELIEDASINNPLVLLKAFSKYKRSCCIYEDVYGGNENDTSITNNIIYLTYLINKYYTKEMELVNDCKESYINIILLDSITSQLFNHSYDNLEELFNRYNKFVPESHNGFIVQLEKIIRVYDGTVIDNDVSVEVQNIIDKYRNILYTHNFIREMEEFNLGSEDPKYINDYLSNIIEHYEHGWIDNITKFIIVKKLEFVNQENLLAYINTTPYKPDVNVLMYALLNIKLTTNNKKVFKKYLVTFIESM